MKVCPSCFSEFRDEATRCDACDATLVSEQEGARLAASRPQPLPDGAPFVAAATADDPFEAEAYVAALREAGLPVFSRDRRRSTVDVLVTVGKGSFWEILVPGDKLAAAREAVERRRRELEASADEAARAAEEEEAATENHVVVGETENESLAAQWAERLAAAGISAVLRAREDVELQPQSQPERPLTFVLVAAEQAEQARTLLRGS